MHHNIEPEPRFDGGFPQWDFLDRLANRWAVRIAFGVAYTLFYVAFAPSLVYFLLLPAHFLMGPIHGAIVNCLAGSSRTNSIFTIDLGFL